MVIIDGFIKLNRALRQHWVATDPEVLSLWIHILLEAAYTGKRKLERGTLVDLSPGQVLFKGLNWAEQTGIHKDKLYRTLQKFRDDGMIEIKKYGFNFSIITVKNWGVYQQGESVPIEKDCEADTNQNAKRTESHKTITDTDLEGNEKKQTAKRENEKLRSDCEADAKLYKKEKKYKNKEDYIYSIFAHWNSKKIIEHRSLTDKAKRKISGTLSNYSFEEIIKAIDNYTIVLTEEKYFWTHKWTLEDFLQRGMDKFLTEECFKNYLNEVKNFKKSTNIAQHNNFEQRQYSEEHYNSFFDNVNLKG